MIESGVFNISIIVVFALSGFAGMYVAAEKGRSKIIWFLLCVIPIFLIVLLFKQPVKEIEGKVRKCPSCKGFIPWDSKFCRHCSFEL